MSHSIENERTDVAAPPATPVPPPGPGAPSRPLPRAVPYERRTRMSGWRSRDILRAAVLGLGVYFLFRLLWVANTLVFAIFLGVLFGLALETGVDYLERWRVPRALGAAGIMLGVVGLLVGAGMAMAPTLREQSRELQRRMPQAIDAVEDWFDARQGGLFGMLLGGSEVAVQDSLAQPGAAQGQAAPADPAGTPGLAPQPEQPTDGEEIQAPSTLRARVGQQLQGATSLLFPFLSSTLTVIAGLLLIVFVAIYIAIQPGLYHAGLMHLFPHRARPRAGEVLTKMAAVLRRWLVTQLIAMVAIGVVTTVVLLLLDVRAAFALGLIAGLLEFVPTIGPIISAVPAIGMGFLDSPQKALTIAIAYVAIQQLENSILIPILMKEGVDLPPAITIVAQALMALIFGFLGLLVAVPMVAAAMVPIKLLYVRGVVGDDVEVLGDDDDD